MTVLPLFDQLARLEIDGPRFRADSEDLSWIASLPVSDDSLWVRYLLIAHAAPDLLGKISHEQALRVGTQRAPESQSLLVSDICTLVASGRAEIERGDLDEVIRSVVPRDKNGRYIRLLISELVDRTSADVRNSIYYRAAIILSESDPRESSYLSRQLR